LSILEAVISNRGHSSIYVVIVLIVIIIFTVTVTVTVTVKKKLFSGIWYIKYCSEQGEKIMVMVIIEAIVIE
jgi:hypothetical protein